jgi:hypothetical protein
MLYFMEINATYIKVVFHIGLFGIVSYCVLDIQDFVLGF